MALKPNFSDVSVIECGCDEVGRGCLAGPVCAAAVIFPYGYMNSQIDDSKKLGEKQRDALAETIRRDALAWAVAEVSVEEIDRINILNASIKCMNKAVAQLEPRPELLLVDGNRFNNELGIPYRCVVKGDATYISIAAASILAKTYRDRLMRELGRDFPEYDWAGNKGYPTPRHIAAVNKHGLTGHHRRTFHLKNQLSLEL
ncbi:MAG: ribonuclease HII [Bacteroidales bacterium]|nr:ribonuclease HII [Bacteroidales bacterium]MDY6347637.1 ribonuclease HII [Bacteroidales bacterium]